MAESSSPLNKVFSLVGLRADRCRAHRGYIICDVDTEEARHIAAKLHDSGVCRFTTCLAYDNRPVDGNFYVVYMLDCRNDTYLGLRIPVPAAVPSLGTLSDAINSPPCVWCEWEIRELYGISFRGHPGKGRFLLPDTWPSNYHPLRKDAPPPPPKTGLKVGGRGGGPARPVLPLGPYHPALHEPEYFELVVEGERVIDARYRGFFVYRGIEKLAEERFTYDQIPFLAERICGICGFTHSIAYCQAVEKALEIDVPERAKYIRALLLEIERIHSHILWAAIMFHTLGFDSGFMHLMAVREAVMDAAEEVTGNRKTYSMAVPGGVRRDVSSDKLKAVVERVEAAAVKALKLAYSYLEVAEVRSRLEEVGVLTRNDALKLGAVGPVARASGVDVDVRRDHPYAAYPNVEFNVVVRDGGDVLSRFLVRLEEIGESIKIIRQLARDMPKTPIASRDYEYKPFRAGVSATEAPRGENIHFIVTGGSSRIWRWKVRAPSYNNISLLPLMLKGYQLADAPVIISSIDPCFSCTDRVTVVDVSSGRTWKASLRSLARRGVSRG